MPLGAVTVLLTVTVTAAEVPVVPAESVATAVMVWVPFVRVVLLKVVVYGAVVNADPTDVPSTLNCTLAIVNPVAAVALAVSVTLDPDIVAPLTGAVTDTVGAAAVLLTVTVTAAEVPVVPAESVATAVMVWVPFVRVVLLKVVVYGAVVNADPTDVPSTLNCTLAIVNPVAAVALAVSVTLDPDIVAPLTGAVTDTVGAPVAA